VSVSSAIINLAAITTIVLGGISLTNFLLESQTKPSNSQIEEPVRDETITKERINRVDPLTKEKTFLPESSLQEFLTNVENDRYQLNPNFGAYINSCINVSGWEVVAKHTPYRGKDGYLLAELEINALAIKVIVTFDGNDAAAIRSGDRFSLRGCIDSIEKEPGSGSRLDIHFGNAYMN